MSLQSKLDAMPEDKRAGYLLAVWRAFRDTEACEAVVAEINKSVAVAVEATLSPQVSSDNRTYYAGACAALYNLLREITRDFSPIGPLASVDADAEPTSNYDHSLEA